jgi:hypothetical protein
MVKVKKFYCLICQTWWCNYPFWSRRCFHTFVVIKPENGITWFMCSKIFTQHQTRPSLLAQIALKKSFLLIISTVKTWVNWWCVCLLSQLGHGTHCKGKWWCDVKLIAKIGSHVRDY